MHHKATVKLGTHDHLMYNIQCTCGTGGDFGSKEEAMNWMNANHFRFLQGVNTAEFVDETPKTESKPLDEAVPVAKEPEKEEEKSKPKKAKSA